jgi:hypothetical protein
MNGLARTASPAPRTGDGGVSLNKVHEFGPPPNFPTAQSRCSSTKSASTSPHEQLFGQGRELRQYMADGQCHWPEPASNGDGFRAKTHRAAGRNRITDSPACHPNVPF